MSDVSKPHSRQADTIREILAVSEGVTPEEYEAAVDALNRLLEQLDAEKRQANENFEAMMDERSKAVVLQEQLEALRSAAEDSLSILDSLKGGMEFSRGEVIARLRKALYPASKPFTFQQVEHLEGQGPDLARPTWESKA